MKLTRDDAEATAVRAAGREVARLGDQARQSEFEEEARNVVEWLYASLTNLRSGALQSDVTEWHHRSDPGSLLDDSGRLGINRQQLISAAEQYCATGWLRDATLDWLVADLLMYAETIATFDSLRVQSLGIVGFAASRDGRLAFRAFALAWAAGKWLAWAAIGWFLYNVSGWTAMVWLGLTGIRVVMRRRALAPLRTVMPELFRAYQSLASGAASWELVWEELRRTREQGAVWDPVLYRLVELRRGRPA